MRLHSLRLQNFRQHADTLLTFDRGLIGIIGPNGSGKSTILEAIAWALYGTPAARGTRDSIRFARAGARATVRVELVFELSGHRYRVVRGLSSAECYLDDGDTPIASTLKGVTELLQRRLGMTRTEFFHTYFTGQKELDVMGALGAADRARFLSRVLGYDRLTAAQEFVRERRRELLAESNGLKQGMPDPDAIWRTVADAEARVAVTRMRADETERQREVAAARLTTLAPEWQTAQAQREDLHQVQAEIRVAEGDALAYARESERLEREIAAIDAAHGELAPLRTRLVALPETRAALAVQEQLASADARRQALLERVRVLAEDEARLAERAAKLESAPSLEQETMALLATHRDALTAAEATLDAERTAWVRDRQEAETRLEALRTQYAELVQQRETLEGLGDESPCPTCGRPLGATHRAVLDALIEQIETVRVDGNYYRQRTEQLANAPAALAALEETRRGLHHEVAAHERRLAKIHAALAEASTIATQRAEVQARMADATQQLAAVPAGYDPGHHEALRASLVALQQVETQCTRLAALVEGEERTRAEWRRVQGALSTARERVVELEQRKQQLPADDASFVALRAAHEAASAEARRTELDALAAVGDAERARAALDSAEQARRDLARLQETLQALEADRQRHEELDRAFTDVRTDLNFQLRPELAEIASGLLDALTDGRYTTLEFDEEYRPLVLEDGVPKPVISGGEEDLCNLVLRLAISQMIAERAGQVFSLLILDEVFGSLDEARRANVMELLRRLNDRFEQVIVITHIEQVRDGLDRLVQVRFDETRGCSAVSVGA